MPISYKNAEETAKLWKAFNQVLPSKLTSTFSSLKIDETTYTTASQLRMVLYCDVGFLNKTCLID